MNLKQSRKRKTLSEELGESRTPSKKQKLIKQQCFNTNMNTGASELTPPILQMEVDICTHMQKIDHTFEQVDTLVKSDSIRTQV